MILKIKKIKILKENKIKVFFKKIENVFLPNVLNIFRRASISKQEGFSPIWIKINKIKHEFEDIRGTEEDMVELIMNIKGLIFKLNNCNSITIMLKKKGLCYLKGSDFNINGFCSVINGDSILTKIKKNVVINMKIKISKSRNKNLYYYPEKKSFDGKIFINSMVSTISRFNFKIKDSGESLITIKTNKTVHPLFFFMNLYKKIYRFMYNRNETYFEKNKINLYTLIPINIYNNKILNVFFKKKNDFIFNHLIFKNGLVKLVGFKPEETKLIKNEFKKIGLNSIK
ncbi:hypothetical protein ACWNX6_00825 [Candidatus Vidania fulgoroideorum]